MCSLLICAIVVCFYLATCYYCCLLCGCVTAWHYWKGDDKRNIEHDHDNNTLITRQCELNIFELKEQLPPRTYKEEDDGDINIDDKEEDIDDMNEIMMKVNLDIHV